ncbi:MAG: tRNA pseudouridine38-40 synthase [Rickettsiales bacterium]|jgi:tRNA pseudouridine38-40 synthase
MSRFKITIEYKGTDFIGWQKQPDNSASIQETIEKAIFKLTGQKADLLACGRTDAGVHAFGHVAHFDLSPEKSAVFSHLQLCSGINHFLINSGIAIIKCDLVDENFHSRFSAKTRHYQYLIANRHPHLTLYKDLAWHMKYQLDLEKMIEAAKYLLGVHDFSSFRDAQCQAKNAIRSIDAIEIFRDEGFVKLNFSARSFLHHQVRNMVGTLVDVGKGKIAASAIKDILEAKDRTKSGANAPACGLYFVGVDY